MSWVSVTVFAPDRDNGVGMEYKKSGHNISLDMRAHEILYETGRVSIVQQTVSSPPSIKDIKKTTTVARKVIHYRAVYQHGILAGVVEEK